MPDQASDRITPRATDYARWYQDVIRQAELAEPAEIVRGCMVIRPHGYAIWERIVADLDARFKACGVQNAYFPLLIPKAFIDREAEHVEGFAPELAVVTHAGGHALEEPYVVRPTSETIIGHFFSRWIESWRDLPLCINQWANVVRWERRTRLFLRTSEFLWQEGHTAHETAAEARTMVRRMLDVYAECAEQLLAMPVVRGVKTATEKFAGAVESHCIEAIMQDGRALQAGTSHDLGQNFGRAFNVTFQDRGGQPQTVWQTSWGTSTRLIGGLIMTHGDDRGLVLPPRLAPVQVVIVPIAHKEFDRASVAQAAEQLRDALSAADVRVTVDTRAQSPGFKFFAWEQKGVPIRIELGPRDLAAGTVVIKERTAAQKVSLPRAGIASAIVERLHAMQDHLLAAARARLADATHRVDTWSDFAAHFAGSSSQFVMAHWDGTAATEAQVKEQTGATIRCMPYDVDSERGACILTGAPSERRVLFAKAY